MCCPLFLVTCSCGVKKVTSVRLTGLVCFYCFYQLGVFKVLNFDNFLLSILYMLYLCLIMAGYYDIQLHLIVFDVYQRSLV